MSWARFKEALLDGATLGAAVAESVLWKKDSEAPDYTPMANASKESAEIMARLGYDQMAMAKQQYDEVKPLLFDVANTQRQAMRQGMEQGQDYYDYMKGTFRPLEQKLVADAKNFNTAAERERMAQQAAADFERQSAVQRGITERNLASMGVNPNSGKFQALTNQNAVTGAAQKAGMMNATRQQARDLGYARQMDAVGLGRGLSGASLGAYQMASGAGNSAGQNYQSPGQGLMAGTAQGANTIGSGQQMQLQGLSNMYGLMSADYRADQSNNSSPLGGLLGAGLAYAMSSKALKDKLGDIDPVAMSHEFEKLDIDQWEYKEGFGDGQAHIGPYAEDVERLGMGDGTRVDLLSMIGATMAAVQGVAQRLSKIEERLQGCKV